MPTLARTEVGGQHEEVGEVYIAISCLIESQVKEMNKRVKGTEKFWNDGDEGEAILQVKAAMISDDDHPSSHIAVQTASTTN